MSQAIIDPEEVRRFVSNLIEVAHAIRSQNSSTKSHFDNLKAVWRDKKYAQFERVFNETVKGLEQFRKDVEKYAGDLRRQANQVDKYLERHY